MHTWTISDADRAKWARPLRDEDVDIVAGPVSVAGHLTIPINQEESSCSRTSAEAAGSAHATSSSPISSTASLLNPVVRSPDTG